MRWPAVMAASIAVHGAVLAALPDGGARALPPPAVVVTIEPAVADPVAPEVVPIEFVTLPETAAAPAPASVAGSAAVPSAVRVSRSAAVSAPVPGTDPEAATAPATGYFRMRSADPVAEAAPKKEIDWTLSLSAITAIMNKPTPEIPVPTGELRANKDGSFTKNDSVYVATINPDGTVRFEDKPNLRISLALPTLRDLKRGLAAWVEDPYYTKKSGEREGWGRSVEEEDNAAYYMDDDGDAKLDEGGVVPIISVGFDATDALIRFAGGDPYQAKKMAFLDRTRDERAEIGRKYKAEQLEQTEKLILDHARKLWARADLDLTAKREGLFELWDDCAETGEAKLVEAGDRGRAALLRFINVHLPKGSAEAYDADELRRLDHDRRSKAHFAPY